MKKPKILWLILLLALMSILVVLIGLVLDILFGLNILSTDLATFRQVNPFTIILSLSYIIIGLLFCINLYKLRGKSIMWWHILIGVSIASILYKIKQPTYIINIIPYYFITATCLAILIWLVIFLYLKKFYRRRLK